MTELAPNQLHSVSVSAAYVADPLALFTQLTTPHDNSLLLESAEIDTKAPEYGERGQFQILKGY